MFRASFLIKSWTASEKNSIGIEDNRELSFSEAVALSAETLKSTLINDFSNRPVCINCHSAKIIPEIQQIIEAKAIKCAKIAEVFYQSQNIIKIHFKSQNI